MGDENLGLMNEAVLALKKSYSPYSKFQVGAAALLENGEIVSGANQENGAYPMCLCAEMVVLSSISARFPGVAIKKMAITIKSANKVIDFPVSPCGACRQTLLEFEERQKDPFQILLRGEVGAVYELESARSLLPLSFDGSMI